MAVYLVSLRRLAVARARRTGQLSADPSRDAGSGPAPTQPEPTHDSGGSTDVSANKVALKRKRTAKRKSEQTAVALPPEEPAATKASADGASEPGSRSSGVGAEVEQLLRLPRAQVGELLASCDEPTRKVLLALIYRLAAVEDELRGVSAKVRSAGVRAIQSATFRAPPPAATPNEKSGLLEQLFQKNVSLRKGL